MPKAKDKKRRSREDDDVEEEFTQPSQSQRKRKGVIEDDDAEPNSQAGKGSQKAKPKLSKAELEAKVAETVRFIIFSDTSKGAIKKSDIVSKVLKDHSKNFQEVITGARKTISKVFGFELEEVEIGASRTKAYILTNNLEQEKEDSFIDWKDQQPKMGLLLIILSIIFMNGNVISEEILWHTLKKMGVEQKKKHRIFADAEKLINQEFVKQLYLERKKVSSGEIPSFEYRWGIRANRELSKRKVLEFVTQIYGYGTDIQLWGSQYRQLLEEEAAEDEDEMENNA